MFTVAEAPLVSQHAAFSGQELDFWALSHYVDSLLAVYLAARYGMNRLLLRSHIQEIKYQNNRVSARQSKQRSAVVHSLTISSRSENDNGGVESHRQRLVLPAELF